jgi:hypothetical protein
MSLSARAVFSALLGRFYQTRIKRTLYSRLDFWGANLLKRIGKGEGK